MSKFRKILMLICVVSTVFILTSISTRVSANSTGTNVITSINDLIEHAKALDEQEVIIQGEAIGERMDRGDYTWININDGTNAIGIWLRKQDADVVQNYGNYKNRGDTLRIIGTFHRACSEHGGEPDVHCNTIEIVESGHPIKEQVSKARVITAALLSFAAIGFFICFYRIIKSRR